MAMDSMRPARNSEYIARTSILLLQLLSIRSNISMDMENNRGRTNNPMDVRNTASNEKKNMYRLRLRPRQRQKPRLNLGLLTLALDLEKIRSNELRGTISIAITFSIRDVPKTCMRRNTRLYVNSML